MTEPLADPGAAYREVRHRVTGLVEAAGDEAAATPVPTCPGWSVADVVAHLAGVCADLVNGSIEGVGTDEWTAAQVEARRGRSVRELVAEWNDLASTVEGLADTLPGRTAAQLIADAATHEHDVRGALGAPGARESSGVVIGADLLVEVALDTVIRSRELAPLRVLTPERSWLAGCEREDVEGTAPSVDDAAGLFSAIIAARIPSPAEATVAHAVTLEVPLFELFRALTGRRSREQLTAYSWSVDPDPYLDAFRFGPFRMSPTPVIE